MHESKIKSLEQLSAQIQSEKAKGKKIVQCHGVFDLVHPGHIRHFKEAKTLGDVLVVTVTRDAHVNKGPGRPAFNEMLRVETLAALEFIDFVALNETGDAVEAIRKVKPDYYVKGQDYENRAKDITQGILAEEEEVTKWGGQIYFTHDIQFSSTQILNSHFNIHPEKAAPWLETYKREFTAETIIDTIQSIKDMKVLLIGDTIIDEYHYCQPLGKSPKETIVSTRYLNEESFPGGILACANHVASFVNKVDLLTVLGRKESKEDVVRASLKSNVEGHFFYREDASTIIKRRFLEPAFLTKMFQISFLTDYDIDKEVENSILRYLSERIDQYDLVLVADYGHGFLTKNIRDFLSSRAPFLALNVQTNSANLGYNLVTKYKSAHYICIDEPELRLATQQRYSPIHEVLSDFFPNYQQATVTITRGHNGSITGWKESTSALNFYETPSFSTKIVDRVGAGDAYLAVTSLLAAKKVDPKMLGFVGNAAGSIAVGIVCNRSSIEMVPLFKYIRALLG